MSNNKRKSVIYKSRPTSISANDVDDVDSKQRQTLELEKLEQEITLTLQDIDRNLGKSNKIINDSLIPVIQLYSKNSKKLWDGTKFWKNFFEDSANVQFSGVEETVANYGKEEEDDDENADKVSDVKMDDHDTTGGQSIINRYYDQVNIGGSHNSSTIIKSTPKKKSQFESSEIHQPPSSPPLLGNRQDVTTSEIFNNINKDGEEINFHHSYKIKMTPNKRQKKGMFADSPDISPPKLTSFSPIKPLQQQQQLDQESSSIQFTKSPPITMSFAKGQEFDNKTPSRVVALSKANDLKEIVGANDSSLQQPPQFTLTNIQQQQLLLLLQDNTDSSVQLKPPQLSKEAKKDFELDSILDNKFKEFNKTNDIDWSDEE